MVVVVVCQKCSLYCKKAITASYVSNGFCDAEHDLIVIAVFLVFQTSALNAELVIL